METNEIKDLIDDLINDGLENKLFNNQIILMLNTLAEKTQIIL